MASIADLFFTFRGEDSQLQVDASKAGDKAGQTLGQRLAGGAKAGAKAGLVGLGALFGAGLGMAIKGAGELDAATRQLQADTGMTAEEAAVAEKALAGMYRNNLQGFDQIGAAMAKVRNDLGLTGEEADAATAKFLKFSTATGQDASEAVTSFDDILDAWNLTAADAGPLMDKLIVSHQKYGGVISESESALAKMAPAMQAGNMSIDDGIAMLNLFNAAGIDASKAPAALAKAVKQLKPGRDINDLIAQIGAIEDPTLRGQKAMEIFGARSGIGMAQAIKPGMTSLADLTASLGDTSGATTDAADAIESGFGAKFKLIMKNAGGALAEFGTNFGPLVLGFGSMLPLLTPVIAGAGAALGGLLAAAIPIGMALLPFLLIAAVAGAVAFLIANPAIVGTIRAFANSVLTAIGSFLGTLPGLLLGIFGTAFGAVVALAFTIPGRLAALGGQIVGSIISGMASLPGRLFEIVAGAFRNLKIDIGPFHISSKGVSIDLPKIKLPFFATGTPFVPRDMIAGLHEGEMVIPAAESAAIRAGQATLGGASSVVTGGATYNVTVNNPEPRAADADMGRMLRRLGAMGITS